MPKMPKDLWINLPVKDMHKSKTFFTEIGFPLNPQHPNNDEAVSLLIGDKDVVVMLFPESTFRSFTGNDLTDTKTSTEVLLSIGANSKEEVDELINKVMQAGGTIYGEPKETGWMYGAGFADLDGHRWNVLYMDLKNMPRG